MKRRPLNLIANLTLGLFASLVFSAQSHAAASGDTAKGEKLSQTCLGCHGAPGLRNASPVYNVPMIGGQHADYIISALNAYKNKKRSHPTMQAQAASLSEQDMADIAAYFTAIADNSHPIDSSRAADGEAKSAVCASCHGKTGDGDNAMFPKLAGQYASYIEQALVDYRSGQRQDRMMSGQASSLTIEDIRDLAAYFGSQDGGLSAPVIKIKK